jgi:hypothetical protein
MPTSCASLIMQWQTSEVHFCLGGATNAIVIRFFIFHLLLGLSARLSINFRVVFTSIVSLFTRFG